MILVFLTLILVAMRKTHGFNETEGQGCFTATGGTTCVKCGHHVVLSIEVMCWKIKMDYGLLQVTGDILELSYAAVLVGMDESCKLLNQWFSVFVWVSLVKFHPSLRDAIYGLSHWMLSKPSPVNQGALEFLAGSLAGVLASRSWHDMPTVIQSDRIHT